MSVNAVLSQTPANVVALTYARKVARLKSILAGSVAVVLAFALVPSANAGRRGTVLESSNTAFAMRDARGDQFAEPSASRAERRAADVRRVDVWQDGDFGWASITLRGRPSAHGVKHWRGGVILTPAAQDEDFTLVVVAIGRSRSDVRVFMPDTPQQVCAHLRTITSHQGRTLTVRVPGSCAWTSPRLVTGTVYAIRGSQAIAGDFVRARCALTWQ